LRLLDGRQPTRDKVIVVSVLLQYGLKKKEPEQPLGGDADGRLGRKKKPQEMEAGGGGEEVSGETILLTCTLYYWKIFISMSQFNVLCCRLAISQRSERFKGSSD
jgi:hypothetical protein